MIQRRFDSAARTPPPRFFVVGISYKTAPVELRERFVLPADQKNHFYLRAKTEAALDEAVLLSTCNRVELYGVSAKPEDPKEIFCQLLDRSRNGHAHLYQREAAPAARHLFCVTSGLDSMVLGETEIAGQVKMAYETAREAGLTGRALNRLFQKALHVAKDVRSRTAIGEGAISAGSVAVELAGEIFTDRLQGKTILIVGAGKIGETCVRHLVKKGAESVIVVNRSLERAQALANDFGGRAMNWEDGLRALREADIVVCSTGCPHKILGKKQLESAMNQRQRPLVLIDLSVPRNIDTDVQQLDHVYLYNIDDLEAVIQKNLGHRQQALSQCNAIIEQHAEEFMAQLRHTSASAACSNRLPQPDWLLYSASVSVH